MNSTTTPRRRQPVGAELQPGGGVHFRVWAPSRGKVEVMLERGGEAHSARAAFPLQAEAGGYFAGMVDGATEGTLYRYRLDDASDLYPDPASRFQPAGPHGPSQVIDPQAFAWSDDSWRGVELRGQVIYEMHAGTLTREGTWSAAARELPELAETGITLLEVMPVAEFPGRFSWGYDGVDLFAPAHLYGTPDEFRRFVDRAHALGIGVILDVVYNHLGPDGNYLRHFSEHYFSARYTTDWGEAINFDDDNSAPVRELFTANAGYWIDEFHLDGLRLDATQNIYDESSEHILAAVARSVRQAARGRGTLLVAEDEKQRTRLLRPPAAGGYGLDAVWNDDFHHTAVVALSGRNEAYYSDYLGTPQEFISSAKHGFLYQGQWYAWQKQRRGTPTRSIAPSAFINFIENHDQLANSGRGLRAHQMTSPGRHRAMTALLLLGPGTPLLFQGQEFSALSPFYYFADHEHALAASVREGRRQFLSQFPSLATIEVQAVLPDPCAIETFERCKLDLSERERHVAAYALHRDLLRLRREDAVFREQGAGGLEGAVLGPQAFALRFFASAEKASGDSRLLVVNFGRDLRLEPAPEPLLAPPEGQRWQVLWSSEDPRYGGVGILNPDGGQGWEIGGESAVVLAPI